MESPILILNDPIRTEDWMNLTKRLDLSPLAADPSRQQRIVGWKMPIEDMYPYLPRDKFGANMIIEPVEGWENQNLPDIIR